MENILKEQKGQGVMEYIIITSLVGIFCLGVMKGFGKVLKERIDDMKEKIVREVKV